MIKDITLPRLFILGTQRSGTTLLCRILSNHPHFFVQNEGMPVRKIFSSVRSIDDLRVNMDNIFREAHNGESINDALKRKKVASWGYKDPQLTEYLDTLELILKEAGSAVKFIVIVRDARGVVNSYIDNKWGLGTNAYTGAQRWKREVQAQLGYVKKYPDLFLLIRFEDLLQDMEQSMRKVCNHIDLEYDPAMLLYHQKKAVFKIKRENINTTKEPDAAIAQKWKKSLSQREVDIIEAVARDELAALGYEISDNRISLSGIEKMYYRIHQKIIGEIQLQYRWRKAAVSNYFYRLRTRRN